MKILPVDPLYRAYLLHKRAIKLDAEGDESLVGLTAMESLEYLAVVSTSAGFIDNKSGIDPERFLYLYDRHVAALTSPMSIRDYIPSYFW